MSTAFYNLNNEVSADKPESMWTRNLRRFKKHKLGRLGLLIIAFLYLTAIFADFLSPYSMVWGDNKKPYHLPSPVELIYRGPDGLQLRPFTWEYQISNIALRTYSVVPEHTVRAISIEHRVGVNELRVVATDNSESRRSSTILRETTRYFRIGTDSEDAQGIQAALADLEASADPDARITLRLSPSVAPSGVETPRTLLLAKGNKNFLSFFNHGIRYEMFGLKALTTDVHFFGSQTGGYFPMGSDQNGRDLWSRILHGSRVSLSVGIYGALITMIGGLIIGGLAGYFGGILDNILMRAAEVVISVPSIYLLFALRASMPASLDSAQIYQLIVLILSLLGWPSVARVIRGQVLAIKNEDFVLAARTMGLSSFTIIRKHVLPGTFSYAIIQTTLSIPGYILGESALSLLGLGITEPRSSWGLMLAVGRNFRVVSDFPFVLIPGFFIFIAILAWNFFGDGVRDALDPKSRH